MAGVLPTNCAATKNWSSNGEAPTRSTVQRHRKFRKKISKPISTCLCEYNVSLPNARFRVVLSRSTNRYLRGSFLRLQSTWQKIPYRENDSNCQRDDCLVTNRDNRRANIHRHFPCPRSRIGRHPVHKSHGAEDGDHSATDDAPPRTTNRPVNPPTYEDASDNRWHYYLHGT